MPTQYIGKRDFQVINSDLKDRFRVEPLEWTLYNNFIARLALKFDTNISTIKKVIEPYILNEDLIFKDIEGKKCFVSMLAIRFEKERKEIERKEIEMARIEAMKEEERTPKTDSEAKDFIKSFKPLKDDV